MKKGWQTKTLGEICTVDWGNTNLTKSAYVEGGEFLAVSAAGCDGRIGHKEHEKYTPVLSAIGAQCGRMFLPEEDFTAIKNTITLTPREGTCTGRFLYQLLTHVELPKRGAAQPFISKGDIQSFEVPVPPLAEQQRIVGLLDEAFEGLATAKANAEKNLQNARALFESHLQSVFTQRGPGWVEKKLEDIADADCSLSYGIVQPGEEFDKGMPIVRPTDLTTKVIRLGGLKRIDPKLAGGYKRTALQGGELLLCVRGSTGVVSIASPELVGANVTRGIVPIRFNRSLLLPEFGFYLISGGPVQSQIREKTYGTALMQINIRDLRLISLSIPPLKEQKTIAAKLDDLREETQRLARLYERKLAALEALKKSLLHQAFTGEL